MSNSLSHKSTELTIPINKSNLSKDEIILMKLIEFRITKLYSLLKKEWSLKDLEKRNKQREIIVDSILFVPLCIFPLLWMIFQSLSLSSIGLVYLVFVAIFPWTWLYSQILKESEVTLYRNLSKIVSFCKWYNNYHFLINEKDTNTLKEIWNILKSLEYISTPKDFILSWQDNQINSLFWEENKTPLLTLLNSKDVFEYIEQRSKDYLELKIVNDVEWAKEIESEINKIYELAITEKWNIENTRLQKTKEEFKELFSLLEEQTVISEKLNLLRSKQELSL